MLPYFGLPRHSQWVRATPCPTGHDRIITQLRLRRSPVTTMGKEARLVARRPRSTRRPISRKAEPLSIRDADLNMGSANASRTAARPASASACRQARARSASARAARASAGGVPQRSAPVRAEAICRPALSSNDGRSSGCGPSLELAATGWSTRWRAWGCDDDSRRSPMRPPPEYIRVSELDQVGPLAGVTGGNVSVSPTIMDAAAARPGARCHRSVYPTNQWTPIAAARPTPPETSIASHRALVGDEHHRQKNAVSPRVKPTIRLCLGNVSCLVLVSAHDLILDLGRPRGYVVGAIGFPQSQAELLTPR